MEESARSRDALLEDLRDLPPSAKLVFKILQYEGELTQEEIIDETFLSPRTTHTAVTSLENQGIITSHVSSLDSRQKIYSLDSDFLEE